MKRFFIIFFAVAVICYGANSLRDPQFLSSGALSPYLSGLVFRAQMGEATGTRVESVNAFNLTAVNSPTNTAAINGFGVLFDRTLNQKLTAANNSALQFGTNSYTIIDWFKPLGSSGQHVISMKGTSFGSGTYEWCVDYNIGSATMQYYTCYNSGVADVTLNNTTGSIVSNGWNFVCARYDAVTRTKFLTVNASTTSASFTNGMITTTGLVRIGADDSTARNFSGGVNEHQMWNTCLTSNDVVYMYSGGTGKFYSGY